MNFPLETFRVIVGDSLPPSPSAQQLEIEGAHERVMLFDWSVLLESSAEDVEAFFNYDVPASGSLLKAVENQELIPFGVSGLGSSFYGFAEISVHGALFLDLRRSFFAFLSSSRPTDDAPVLFVPNTGVAPATRHGGKPIHRLTKDERARRIPLTFRQLMASRR